MTKNISAKYISLKLSKFTVTLQFSSLSKSKIRREREARFSLFTRVKSLFIFHDQQLVMAGNYRSFNRHMNFKCQNSLQQKEKNCVVCFLKTVKSSSIRLASGQNKSSFQKQFNVLHDACAEGHCMLQREWLGEIFLFSEQPFFFTVRSLKTFFV